MKKGTVQKILIIRSATFNFHRAIDFMKEAYPEAELDILLPEELSSGLRQDKSFHRVFSSRHKGHFGIFKLSQNLREEMRKRKYDLIITLYNNKSGAGYLNVDLMACLLRPGTQAAFNADDELVLITKRKLAVRFAKEIGMSLFSFFSISIFSMMFMLITLSILLLDGARRIYGLDKGQISATR
jgi:hypothetical protein